MKSNQAEGLRAAFQFNEANIARIEGLGKLLDSLSRRIEVSYSSSCTVQAYRRAVRDLSLFHGCLPGTLGIDPILEYLHFLKAVRKCGWAKVKSDVAGIKYFFREVVRCGETAGMIPYPREERPLPKLLSREELTRLFDAMPNPKYRAAFRLVYGSGLRRGELIRLRVSDLETGDGKCRILIRKGKGGKDRYTVLSRKSLEELREYYRAERPVDYLFNGQRKGTPVSEGALKRAMDAARERAGIEKQASPHILRHCFASHALEDGMGIRTLQELMGHSSIQTTMVYLHVSDLAVRNAFSPLDNIKGA